MARKKGDSRAVPPPDRENSDERRRAEPGSEGFSSRRLSRRELLKRAGLAGAATALPLSAIVPARAIEPAQEPFETLTAAASDTLEAIVARLIPSDANGPGAAEARAAHYIDRALTGPLASSQNAYASGLAAVNRYADESHGAAFAELGTEDQDTVLSDMESDRATGFTPDSSTFFNLLRTHTIEGTFCDPYYGGNANFVGWDLIGYPGVRTIVGPGEQRMDETPAAIHRSAYDYSTFTKGGA